MRARHRLSKLLLRQGIVYDGGPPGPVPTTLAATGRRRIANEVTRMAFESDYEHVLMLQARRRSGLGDRGDGRRQ